MTSAIFCRALHLSFVELCACRGVQLYSLLIIRFSLSKAPFGEYTPHYIETHCVLAIDIYSDSRAIGRMWCNAGKPKHGYIYELYWSAKARCKCAIRYFKIHENALRKESLAKKLMDKNPNDLWK